MWAVNKERSIMGWIMALRPDMVTVQLLISTSSLFLGEPIVLDIL